ncbi:hypothetical protein L7F22_056013 [Adiantum nelumboides]|nr:hypothetical protein [Adiantum nelumboides]
MDRQFIAGVLLCSVWIFHGFLLPSPTHAHDTCSALDDNSEASCFAKELLSSAQQEDNVAWLKAVRRKLHQIPETCYEEFETSQFIRDELQKLGVSYKWPFATTGIVATIGSGKAPVVALRADMDGLPLDELVELDYKSMHPGRMHACGHDMHVTMLLGAAKVLKGREEKLQRNDSWKKELKMAGQAEEIALLKAQVAEMSAVLAKPQVKDFLKTLAKEKEKGQEQRKEHNVNAHAVTEEGEPSKKSWEEDIPELSSQSYSPFTSFSYSSDSSFSSNPRRRSKSTKRNQPKKSHRSSKKRRHRHARKKKTFKAGDKDIKFEIYNGKRVTVTSM